MIITILKVMIVFLPWKVRRIILNKCWGYDIHPKAHIGLSYIYPKFLKMDEGARIGHLNVAIHLERIIMEKDCTISQKNWITGFPIDDKSNFQDFPDRKPWLVMKTDSAITKNHLIDCTDMVTIGEYTSIGGYGTQILSHSTSRMLNRQSCAPITIGHHCFVGTRSIILPGSLLPNQSVLGAGAVLKKQFSNSFALYGGVPAKYVKDMDASYEFFHRKYRPK